MSTDGKDWEKFEDVFRAVLNEHREFFELEEVEPGPAVVPGRARKVSPWSIEVVGYRKGSRRLVIFECKHRGRNVEPEQAGGFAYRIEDTGAEQGYLVTPMDRRLSRGAQEIADFEKIGHIQLERESTPDDYVMACADSMFIGITDIVRSPSEEVEMIIRRVDGTEERKTLEG